MLKKGDRVICVDTHNMNRLWVHKLFAPNIPKLGHFYTIREVDKGLDGVGVLLKEVRNPVVPFGIYREIAFYDWRFTKLGSDDILVGNKIEEEVNG